MLHGLRLKAHIWDSLHDPCLLGVPIVGSNRPRKTVNPKYDLCTQIVAGQLDQSTGIRLQNVASTQLQWSTMTQYNLLFRCQTLHLQKSCLSHCVVRALSMYPILHRWPSFEMELDACAAAVEVAPPARPKPKQLTQLSMSAFMKKQQAELLEHSWSIGCHLLFPKILGLCCHLGAQDSPLRSCEATFCALRIHYNKFVTVKELP